MFFSGSSWKFVGGFLAIIALALGSLAVSGYFFNPERQAERELKELERQYAEDTYGGKTPEETLELFISALESGDIELASKYFVIDKREEWRSRLQDISNNSNLGLMIEDLMGPKNKYQFIDGNDDRYIYEILNGKNQLTVQIDIGKGPTGIWKIIDM